MTKSQIFHINIPDVLGGLSDYDEDRSDTYLMFWDEVIDVFSYIDLEYNGCTVHYDFNWGNIKDIVQKDKEYNIPIQKYCLMTVEEQERYKKVMYRGWNELSVECAIIIISKDSDEYFSRAHHANYLESFLYDLFLILNLSEPGCFNLHNTSFDIDDRFKVEINLSSHMFAGSISYSDSTLWPEIMRIPVQDTWNWYKSLGIGLRQMAHTRTERAILSLFHICLEHGANPTTIIWLSESLEALYDTPGALINQILRERIMLFLGKPEINLNKVKKQINEFYNLRSRFVHGDFPVLHPACNEILDSKVDKIREELFQGYDFGFTILIATLQKMIVRKFKNLQFSEVYSGDIDLEQK